MSMRITYYSYDPTAQTNCIKDANFNRVWIEIEVPNVELWY